MSKPKRQLLKTGEKVLFAIVGVFVVLATIAYIALEVVRMNSDKEMFVSKTSFDFSEAGQRGSKYFRKANCTSCHRAVRNGTNMGVDLDGVGSIRSYDWIYSFLTNPEKTYGAKTIDHGLKPKEAYYVAEMPDNKLRDIAHFISELKAEQGSSSSAVPPEGRSEFIDNMVKMWAPPEWDKKYGDVRNKPVDSVITQHEEKKKPISEPAQSEQKH